MLNAAAISNKARIAAMSSLLIVEKRLADTSRRMRASDSDLEEAQSTLEVVRSARTSDLSVYHARLSSLIKLVGMLDKRIYEREFDAIASGMHAAERRHITCVTVAEEYLRYAEQIHAKAVEDRGALLMACFA